MLILDLAYHSIFFRVLFVEASIHCNEKTVSRLRSPWLLLGFLGGSLLFILFNVTCFVWQVYGKQGADRSPILLYQVLKFQKYNIQFIKKGCSQACIQPNSQFSISAFHVMPINQLLLFVVDMVIIFGNLYLYKFLQLDTERREKGVLKILSACFEN